MRILERIFLKPELSLFRRRHQYEEMRQRRQQGNAAVNRRGGLGEHPIGRILGSSVPFVRSATVSLCKFNFWLSIVRNMQQGEQLWVCNQISGRLHVTTTATINNLWVRIIPPATLCSGHCLCLHAASCHGLVKVIINSLTHTPLVDQIQCSGGVLGQQAPTIESIAHKRSNSIASARGGQRRTDRRNHKPPSKVCPPVQACGRRRWEQVKDATRYSHFSLCPLVLESAIFHCTPSVARLLSTQSHTNIVVRSKVATLLANGECSLPRQLHRDWLAGCAHSHGWDWLDTSHVNCLHHCLQHRPPLVQGRHTLETSEY